MTAEYVRGRSELARMYRRNIVRYCELAQVLVFRDISMRTRRRFPTLDTVVAAGFMMPHEKERFDEIQYRYSKYWVPFQWALALTYDARKRGLIESDYYQVVVQEEIKKFRTGLAWICNYDWVPIPIMYPQLVCLAVHTYFIVCLLARQYIISENSNKKTEVDLYFPIMSTLQFIFYMGWMKVAEAMLNPFGEDDDDFECNALIDRNITMVLMMVDQGYDRPPDLKRDPFWDEEVEPLYSEESAKIPNNQLKGSVSEVRQERRQSRPSIGSLEMFRSFKNKVGRSLSRGQIYDEEQPRKTVSHGHLPILDQRGAVKTEENNSTGEKSFSNAAFIDSQEDVNASPETNKTVKEVRKSSSTTNLKSPHDFQHHVLDDVLEENEEEMNMKTIRKRSSVGNAGNEEGTNFGVLASMADETRISLEPSADDENEPTEKRKSKEFFIGQDNQG
ncbi:hypothetical protein RB195_000435 [Necator americanus]|uniref:Bestrophin homolog n=1 Tax=Necator americanus TaxID=51031 RepID=A0ABR1D9Q6_NECAM